MAVNRKGSGKVTSYIWLVIMRAVLRVVKYLKDIDLCLVLSNNPAGGTGSAIVIRPGFYSGKGDVNHG